MDVYHELLGIPPEEQPPNYYRLLGIAPFEADREVILNATRRQSAFVRTVSLVYPVESQNLLNELMAAKLCLLDRERRDAYNLQLRDAAVAGQPLIAPVGVDSSPFKLGGGLPGSDLAAPEEESSSRRLARMMELDDPSDSFALVGQSWSLPQAADLDKVTRHPDAEWIVGSGSGAQIRVRAPWVSRRHCHIWRDHGELFVEDLGSTNGTYVNGKPIDRRTRVRKEDVVTLGRKTRIPWPIDDECEQLDMRIFSIGRAPDNDYVIDDKSVSQHHAQIVLQEGRVFLEDLDSRNGTRVGLLDNRINRCELEPHLSIYFGSTKVFARDLLKVVKKLP